MYEPTLLPRSCHDIHVYQIIRLHAFGLHVIGQLYLNKAGNNGELAHSQSKWVLALWGGGCESGLQGQNGT